MDQDLSRYVDAVVDRLRDHLGDRRVAVYLIGSIASGDYLPGRSDVDIMAVSGGPVSTSEKQDIVSALSHRELPCPARGLEFVLYDQAD